MFVARCLDCGGIKVVTSAPGESDVEQHYSDWAAGDLVANLKFGPANVVAAQLAIQLLDLLVPWKFKADA